MHVPNRLARAIGRQVRKPLRRLGYDIVATRDVERIDVRMHWINRLGVDLVIDVGANEGQFVGWIRDRGYKGPIVSFEPQPEAFDALSKRWGDDPNWRGHRTALGSAQGNGELHLAGNSMSSSLLPMLDTHVIALPQSAIVSVASVPVERLDRIALEGVASKQSIFLKIDTQGYERPVLDGAAGLLDKVTFIEAELSLVPLYAGQALLPEMIEAIGQMGFTLVWLEEGFSDLANGRLLQVDGLFVRTSRLAAG